MKPRFAANSLIPFLSRLGWDIDNEEGYAEAYKDVVHEDAIKIGDGARARLLFSYWRRAQIFS